MGGRRSRFGLTAAPVPIGLGSYVQWDRRLDAALASAVMSINIVKGVELGMGFEQTRRFGSAVHDVIEGRGEAGRWIHRSNNAGGLTAGISNGEPIVVRGAVKPISTLARPLPVPGPRLQDGPAVLTRGRLDDLLVGLAADASSVDISRVRRPTDRHVPGHQQGRQPRRAERGRRAIPRQHRSRDLWRARS